MWNVTHLIPALIRERNEATKEWRFWRRNADLNDRRAQAYEKEKARADELQDRLDGVLHGSVRQYSMGSDHKQLVITFDPQCLSDNPKMYEVVVKVLVEALRKDLEK